MAKQYKIKHYKNYSSDVYARTSRRKAILAVITAILLFLLGWILYQPVYDFFTGFAGENPSDEIPLNLDSSQSSAPEETPVISPDPDPGSDPDPAVPEPEETLSIRAVYAPHSILKSAEEFDSLLASLQGTSVNAVMLDLKDTTGHVTYRSSLAKVQASNAISSDAIDMSVIIAKLKSHGLIPVARIHAFRDHIAANAIRAATVKYMDTEIPWLDNSLENGGRQWLNPYSEEARSYVTDIAYEASVLGFQWIIMDSFHFPIGFSLHLASYGPQSALKSQNQVLADYAQELRTGLEERGVKLSVYFSATTALGMNQERYGGNPLNISGSSTALGVMPQLFGSRYSIGDLTIEAPVQNPYSTVKTVLSHVAPLAEDTEFVPFLQAFTDQGIPYSANKAYTKDDIYAQISAVEELGITSYVIYNPAGTYDLN